MASDDAAAPRLSPRRARTRQALLSAAQAYLAEGRTAVSIQEITARAGVGFGSFHNHFDSKDALFEAAVAETITTYATLLEDLVADIADPVEVFAASFRLTGRLQRRLPQQVRVLLNSGTSILSSDQGLARLARRDIRNGMADGRFDIDNEDLGFMAVGGALLGLLQLLDDQPELDDGEVSDAFTQRVLRALGVSPEEAAHLCQRGLPELSGFA